MLRPEPLSFVLDGGALCAAAVLLVVWTVRRRAGAGASSSWQSIAFATAAGVLVAADVSPLATLARWYLESAHLIQTTLTMALAAPLLLLSLPRTGLKLPRALTAVTNPWVAGVSSTGTFLIWHATPLYNAALASPSLYTVQQTSFLLVALLFWWPIIEPMGDGPSLSPMGRLTYISASLVPQTLAGVSIALAGHLIYSGYGTGPAAVGWSPFTDQALAGSLIALLNKIALVTAFLLVLSRLLDGTDADDGGGGRRHRREPILSDPDPRDGNGPTAVPEWYGRTDGELAEEPTVVTVGR